MIAKDKEVAAMKALQAVIIRGRTMALERADHREIADLMDGAEYLAALLWEERDMTTTFRSYLVELASRHGCGLALAKFEEGP